MKRSMVWLLLILFSFMVVSAFSQDERMCKIKNKKGEVVEGKLQGLLIQKALPQPAKDELKAT